jgi:hypothetical protein
MRNAPSASSGTLGAYVHSGITGRHNSVAHTIALLRPSRSERGAKDQAAEQCPHVHQHQHVVGTFSAEAALDE